MLLGSALHSLLLPFDLYISLVLRETSITMPHSFDRQSSPVKAYQQSSDHASSVDDQPQLNVGGHGGTQRHLRNYQVTMIGFCSGIGTGLFVGSGAAYAKAGPAGLLLAYSIVGVILWCVMQSISEMATLVRMM